MKPDDLPDGLRPLAGLIARYSSTDPDVDVLAGTCKEELEELAQAGAHQEQIQVAIGRLAASEGDAERDLALSLESFSDAVRRAGHKLESTS